MLDSIVMADIMSDSAVVFTAEFISDVINRSGINTDGNCFLILANALDVSPALDAALMKSECLHRISIQCHEIWNTSCHMYKQDANGMQPLVFGKDAERYVMQTIVLAILNNLAIVSGRRFSISGSHCHSN